MLRCVRASQSSIDAVKYRTAVWRTFALTERWLHRTSENIVVAYGASVNYDTPNAKYFYVEDITRPYILFRESRDRARFFIMKLDLENPKEPEGGTFTAREAIERVSQLIAEDKRELLPVNNPTEVI
jgi:hypothetical protein